MDLRDMQRSTEPTVVDPTTITRADSNTLPVGFGHGRRANRIALIACTSAAAAEIPDEIYQWGEDSKVEPFTRDVIAGLLWASEQTGFHLVWHNWQRQEAASAMLDALFPEIIDAVVLFDMRDSQAEILEALNSRAIPHVSVFRSIDNPREPWVVSNNCEVIAQMVKYIADLGHTRIAYIGGSEEIHDFRERRQGFLIGMERLRLPVPPEMVVDSEQQQHVDPSKENILRLLRLPERPTAVICDTDDSALLVLKSAWETGIEVPRDLAVVGFDDDGKAAIAVPPLTTVRQPIQHIASQAFYLAACAVVGQEPWTATWQLTLPNHIVVRQSCGARTPSEGGPSGAAAELARAQEGRIRHLEAVNDELRDWLSTASHDLRSPLVTINGFADTLSNKYGGELSEQAQHYLTRIRRSAENLTGLMDALLSLSRSHKEPLDLMIVETRHVVNEVIDNLEGLLAAGNCQVIVSPDMPVITADSTALCQIFLNLLTNAIKYAGDQPEPIIEIGYTRGEKEHEFFVKDNGIGIAPEHHERVFQLFARVSTDDTSGTGVGLANAKTLVLRHGGRIWVESTPGEGSTFRFTVPIRGQCSEFSLGDTDDDTG